MIGRGVGRAKDVFTADPEDARAGEANVILQSIVGSNSLLLLDGKRHVRERKLMMPPFHGERMREYGEVMADVTARRIARWPRGKAFPVHPEMQAITLDVILRVVFGFEGDRLATMREILTRFTDLGTSRLGTLMLLLTPPAYAERIFGMGAEPVRVRGRTINLSALVPWAPIARAGRDVDAALYEELGRRRADAATARRADILSMLLSVRDEHGEAMSDPELRDEMITLLLAGHETTATTLAWTIHFVLKHPEVHARIARELREVCGDRTPTPDEVGKLEYLDATIKESMRLMPIIMLVGRRLKKPMHLGGYDLPANSAAAACIHLAHRRAETYPNPERFDPARFVGVKPSPYEFFPFGGGTRRCLGMAFASYEMKIVLAEIFARSKLTAAAGDKVVPMRRGITLAPSGGVRVVAR